MKLNGKKTIGKHEMPKDEQDDQSRIHRAQMAERRIVSRTSESSWMDRSSMCRGLGCISQILCALDASGSSVFFFFLCVLASDDGCLIQQPLSLSCPVLR